MRIAISGLSGCGNSTVTKLVGEKLGLTVINFSFKQLAQEKGLSEEEIQVLAERDPRFDFELDERNLNSALENEGIVWGNRLSAWFLSKTGKADLVVWLEASLKERERRIEERAKLTGKKQVSAEVRDGKNARRYIKLYRIDVGDIRLKKDGGIFDLVIDSERLSPEEIAEIIVKKARELLAEKAKGKKH